MDMDSERLARYLAGEASADDRAQVEAWAASEGSRASELRLLEKAWRNGQPPGQWNVDFAWTQVAGRLDHTARPKPAWQRRQVFGWLAAAGLAAMVGGGWWAVNRPTVFQTGVGQSRDLTLADGSRITLAPSSRLTVSRSFGRTSREVALAGKGWFEVDHDAARPFRVSVGDARVEDLGTQFEIDASGQDLKVAVMEGEVSLTMPSTPTMLLRPKDVAWVGKNGQAGVSHDVAVDRLITWRKGSLAFEDRSLAEVTAELARWHEVTFEAAPVVLDRRFTGDLPTNDLDEALVRITTAVGLTATRNGTTVTLTLKAAP